VVDHYCRTLLKQFVKETPAHLDIAGTVWTEKENGYNSPGATGYGVRTLVNWVLSNVKSEVAAPPSRNAHMYPVGATKDTFANSKKTISGSRVEYCPPY